MSIVIPQRLSIKTKSKAKANNNAQTNHQNEDNGEEFDAKVEQAKSAVTALDTKAKAKTNIAKTEAKDAKQTDELDSTKAVVIKDVKQDLKEQHITQNILAKQVVSQNQAKQELGIKKD
ncbi:MAG: hypothetical protein RL154_485, partial [Pseudomonadota bacterium]